MRVRIFKLPGDTMTPQEAAVEIVIIWSGSPTQSESNTSQVNSSLVFPLPRAHHSTVTPFKHPPGLARASRAGVGRSEVLESGGHQATSVFGRLGRSESDPSSARLRRPVRRPERQSRASSILASPPASPRRRPCIPRGTLGRRPEASAKRRVGLTLRRTSKRMVIGGCPIHLAFGPSRSSHRGGPVFCLAGTFPVRQLKYRLCSAINQRKNSSDSLMGFTIGDILPLGSMGK